MAELILASFVGLFIGITADKLTEKEPKPETDKVMDFNNMECKVLCGENAKSYLSYKDIFKKCECK